MFENTLLAFVPVFVAVDALGMMPIFATLTHGLNKRKKRRVIVQSVVTALSVAVAFIFLGKAIFRLLGVTIGDFFVAGGAILFCIAIMDLLRPGKQRRMPAEGLGVVPLGTPLIVGPAVLTTSLILVDEYGLAATLISVFVNILLVGIMFLVSERILKVIGITGARALSRITALLLAAIAVMMMRKGVLLFLASLKG